MVKKTLSRKQKPKKLKKNQKSGMKTKALRKMGKKYKKVKNRKLRILPVSSTKRFIHLLDIRKTLMGRNQKSQQKI